MPSLENTVNREVLKAILEKGSGPGHLKRSFMTVQSGRGIEISSVNCAFQKSSFIIVPDDKAYPSNCL